MYIYLSLIFPIIGSILLYIFFKRYVAWWECTSMFLVILLFTFIMKVIGENSGTTDVEYIQDYVIKVVHSDEWDEWIEETCTRECCCETDKDGHETCGTETYDCSYRKYHPEYWTIETYNGYSYDISKEKYYSLLKQFKTTENFVEKNRDYYRIDGDVHSFDWNNEVNTVEYVTSLHTYENRIQSSNSILNFPDVDTADVKYFNLKEYPNIINLKVNSLIGDNNVKVNNYINQTNSLFASKKQVKIFYLIYKNKPLETGLLQEQYWKGGNKNEVNICIGIDSITRVVKWCYVFSWTKSDIVKIKIRDNINNITILNDSTYYNIVNFTNNVIIEKYERRHFKEFYYITIDPTTTLVIWTYIISFLLTLGMCVFIIKNHLL